MVRRRNALSSDRSTLDLEDAKWSEFSANYRQAFISSSVRHNFNLMLTGPMMEMLCAIADGVVRDREYHWAYSISQPGNWVGQVRHLIKRGLVYHVPRALQPVETAEQHAKDLLEGTSQSEAYKLTPIGEKLVELLKVAGLFVKADAAIDKEARHKRRRA